MRPFAESSDAAALQRLQQHDGARDRQRRGRTRAPAPIGPAPQRSPRRRRARWRTTICDDRAGQRDLAHRQQVVDREVQADAEHQQHHADLGELARRCSASATKPGVAGPIDDAREQVADQRRQAQPGRDEAEDQRQREAGGERGDQADGMGQGGFLVRKRQGSSAFSVTGSPLPSFEHPMVRDFRRGWRLRHRHLRALADLLAPHRVVEALAAEQLGMRRRSRRCGPSRARRSCRRA